jgi:hypothetical protein
VQGIRQLPRDERDQPGDEGHDRESAVLDKRGKERCRDPEDEPEQDSQGVEMLPGRYRDAHRIRGLVVKRERRVHVR